MLDHRMCKCILTMTNYIQLISGRWPFNNASKQLNCAQAAILNCTNIPAQQFCEEICDQLICDDKTWETTNVKLLEVLTCLEEVQIGLQGLEASVLEETGISGFFKDVSAISKQCRNIISAIEELWCYRTSMMSNLADRCGQRELLYQTL